MPGVDAVFERVSLDDGSLFAIRIPRTAHNEFWTYVNAVEKKTNGYFRLQIGPPARPITRGYRSQMARHFGHCQDIADQLSDPSKGKYYTKDRVDRALRVLAVREHFPTQYDDISDEVEPIHMSQCTVDDANLLDRVKQRWCDERGFWLSEYRTLTDGTLEPYRSIAGRTYEEMRAYWKEREA